MNAGRNPTVPKILRALSRALGAAVKNNRLEIPKKFGRGYCAGFVFNQDMRLLISNYELKSDLTIANPELNGSGRMIFFKFQNIFPKQEDFLKGNLETEAPSVLIATSRIHTDESILIHTNTAVINIEVNADYLHGLFDSSQRSPVLESLLRNTQPLVFEQLIYPSLQKIVDAMLTERVEVAFQLFFLRIKAEELICRLLMELDRRDEKLVYALNQRDIQALYDVKQQILSHLETPPVISKLAASAGMSPTKLKRLFRQIFGNSIFNYYQQFRMNKAARLLKEEKLSVSDAGYQLGFTNLSHFSRVFQKHIGVKPKQYSRE